MDGLLNILQSLSKPHNDKAFPQFIKSYTEHQSFKNLQNNDGIIQHITALMSKPETRYNGYLILTSCFNQIPLDVVEQKAVLWSTLSLKACSQKGSDDIAPLGFRLLRLIASQSSNIPDLSKSFSNNVIGKISEVVEQSPSSGHLEALKCVEICIRMFPGACAPVRGKLEKFILKFIDSTDENLVLWSAKCFHILQQIKGGSVEGLNAKQAWHFYQTKLIGNLHQLLEILFANVTEFYDDPIEKATLKIPALKLSDEPIARAYQAVTRFNNLVTFLKVALKEPFTVAKQVTPRKILNLIVRGLSVNCDMLAKNAITDNLAVGAVLPSVHIQLLSLLDALVAVMGSHMLQHYKTILEFCFETLKWTETKKSSGKQKPYCNLRIAVYKSLSFWCSSMKFGSCVEVIADDIFKQIDYDISAFQNELTLQVLSGAKKHMSKKARRQLHKVQNENSNMNKKHSYSSHNGSKQIFSDEGNQSLCTAALNCLRDVLLSSSCFVKPTLMKDIQDKMLSLALSLAKNSGQREKLYSHHVTRRAFYEVLETLIVANHHMCPPPTVLIIKFIIAGSIEDPHDMVKEVCLNILRRLEKVVHPQKDCLYFPPNIKDIENVFSRYGRSLESRNEEEDTSEEEEIVQMKKIEDHKEESEEDDDIAEENEVAEEEKVDAEEEKVRERKSDDEDAESELGKPGETVGLTKENLVATEVIESSDEGDCFITEVAKGKEESEEEAEPMQRLVVESDDENLPSTSGEPASKKLKIECKVRTQEEDDKLFEDIASTFVDELCFESE